MDAATRDRILKRMVDAGGARRIAGQLLAETVGDDGWDTVSANRFLAMLSERDILNHSTDLLGAVTAENGTNGFNADDPTTTDMIGAILDVYAGHDIEPLVAWFDTHAEELER